MDPGNILTGCLVLNNLLLYIIFNFSYQVTNQDKPIHLDISTILFLPSIGVAL